MFFFDLLKCFFFVKGNFSFRRCLKIEEEVVIRDFFLCLGKNNIVFLKFLFGVFLNVLLSVILVYLYNKL